MPSCLFFLCIYYYAGILSPVENLTSEYDKAASIVNISWSPPPALTVTGESRPMRYYCVGVINQVSPTVSIVDSIGCNVKDERNEKTSILLENLCGAAYTIYITPYNTLGNGISLSIAVPGELILYIILCKDKDM